MKMKLDTTFWELYDNCVFSLIVHAISNLQFPEFSYEESWDDVTYCFHFEDLGGTISFDLSKEIVVGALREDLSDRISLYKNPDFNATDFYNDTSDAIKELATNEALQYLDDRETLQGLFGNVGRRDTRVITSAFWGERGEVYAYDEVDEFKKHGGEYVLEELCANRSQLIEYKKEYYSFDGDDEITTAEYIFQCLKKGQLKIKNKEVPIINKQCVGYKECLESLSELGIYIE